jgi:hypothetical protein
MMAEMVPVTWQRWHTTGSYFTASRRDSEQRQIRDWDPRRSSLSSCRSHPYPETYASADPEPVIPRG